MMKQLGYSLLLSALFLGSCNDRTVTPLDQSLTSSTGQDITVDAKTKIDILFVIDESQSMADEQASLSANFSTFSDFIFEDLKNAVDYRIAVVSTGKKLASDIYGGVQADNLGAFISKSNDQSDGCPVDLNRVISPTNLGCSIEDEQCQRVQLKSQFSCAAKVGVDGVVFERGLEAMRTALSCNGPNADFLGACCEYNEALKIFEYDPLCRNEKKSMLAPPEFLRPDAFLVVVFITDEDDCSTYADAPIDSPYATCSIDYLELKGLLGSGDIAGRMAANTAINSAYSNPRYCAPGNPQGCYASECTDAADQLVEPVDCYFTRCALTLNTDTMGRLDQDSKEACRRQAHKLAPVSYYHSFLMGLKARPNDQLIVANIVAPGLLTPSGYRMNFSSEAPMDRQCADSKDYLRSNLDSCCPGGNCGAIPDLVSCPNYDEDLDGDGIPDVGGYSAWRYIDLMSMFGENGLGCRESESSGCVNLCDADLNAALGALRAKVISAVGEYCVARRPACLVTDGATAQTRPCVDIELDVPENYQLQLRQVCELSPEENGDCGVVGTEKTLTIGLDYELNINDTSCASGMRVQLTSPPKAGQTTKMDFLQGQVTFDQ